MVYVPNKPQYLNVVNIPNNSFIILCKQSLHSLDILWHLELCWSVLEMLLFFCELIYFISMGHRSAFPKVYTTESQIYGKGFIRLKSLENACLTKLARSFTTVFDILVSILHFHERDEEFLIPWPYLTWALELSLSQDCRISHTAFL